MSCIQHLLIAPDHRAVDFADNRVQNTKLRMKWIE